MRLLRVSWCAAVMACVGLVLPAPGLQAAEAQSPVVQSGDVAARLPLVRDVALTQDGALTGQVVDAQGKPQSGAVVLVGQPGKEAVRATTAADGRFQVAGLRSGVYQIAAGDEIAIFRVWTANAAPPAATAAALIVARADAIAGQMPLKNVIYTNTFIITSLVATAIAVPVIIHNSHHRASGS